MGSCELGLELLSPFHQGGEVQYQQHSHLTTLDPATSNPTNYCHQVFFREDWKLATLIKLFPLGASLAGGTLSSHNICKKEALPSSGIGIYIINISCFVKRFQINLDLPHTKKKVSPPITHKSKQFF